VAHNYDCVADVVAGGGQARRSEPSPGSLLRVDDATSADWEIHSTGDELLLLLSGEAHVAVDRSNSSIARLEHPYQACVIPGDDGTVTPPPETTPDSSPHTPPRHPHSDTRPVAKPSPRPAAQADRQERPDTTGPAPLVRRRPRSDRPERKRRDTG